MVDAVPVGVGIVTLAPQRTAFPMVTDRAAPITVRSFGSISQSHLGVWSEGADHAERLSRLC